MLTHFAASSFRGVTAVFRSCYAISSESRVESDPQRRGDTIWPSLLITGARGSVYNRHDSRPTN